MAGPSRESRTALLDTGRSRRYAKCFRFNPGSGYGERPARFLALTGLSHRHVRLGTSTGKGRVRPWS
jgi:hypothetical protein